MINFKRKFAVKLSVVALVLAGISTAHAQDETQKKVEIGFRLMPTVSAYDVRTSDGQTVKGEILLGFGAGGFLAYNFSRHVGFQTEVVYNSISQKYSERDYEHKINLRYVNIPLLLSINTSKTKAVNFNLVAGPQLGINVGSNMTTSGPYDESRPEPILAVKKNDIGFAYGAGLDFALNAAHTVRLGIGYRGVLGLIDISDNSQSKTTDSYYVLDRTHLRTHSAYAGLSVLF